MDKVLIEVQNDLCQVSNEVSDAINLLDYLREDMEYEIYTLAKEENSGLIRSQRIEMMFSLLSAARCALCTVTDMQSDLYSRLNSMRAGNGVHL